MRIYIWTVFKVCIFRERDSEGGGGSRAFAGKAMFPYALLWVFCPNLKQYQKRKREALWKVLEEILTGAHFYS